MNLVTVLFLSYLGTSCTTAIVGYINTNFVLAELLPWILYNSNSVTLSECFMLCQTSTECRGITYQMSTEGCKLVSYDHTTRNTISPTLIGSSASVPGETTWIFYHTVRGCNQTACPVKQGYTYIAEICFCVKYHPARQSYTSAAIQCGVEGGELIKIDKPIKQAYVEQYLNTLSIDLENRIYMQGRKMGDSWKYDDGTVITYFNWHSSEPSAGVLETILFISTTHSYKWSDGGPGNYAFLCEIKL